MLYFASIKHKYSDLVYKIIRSKLHKIIGRIEFTNRGNVFFILF